MTWILGNRIKINIFGESHGPAIGGVVEGLASGIKIDMEELEAFLDRRAPGKTKLTSTRKEEDRPVFHSGLLDGYTIGTPIAFTIKNSDHRSSDYSDLAKSPRPSHADLTARLRFGDGVDMRGGGNFSGRLTAPICVIGGILIQLLRYKGISIGAHLYKVGPIIDANYNLLGLSYDDTEKLKNADFPTIDQEVGRRMQDYINEVRSNKDSIGAIIECGVVGLKAGYGNPMFEGIESSISKNLFSIPGVKGIEFGQGFGVADMLGSDHNDGMYYKDDGSIGYYSNNSAGIIGGISTGMPIVFRLAVKPTSSIGIKQKTIDLLTKKNVTIEIKGRHDPCIGIRMVPVVEAMTAISLADFVL
ncbi:chorismate synthase [Peptostreptococcus stomatis]|uniref:chorismate synthase n=1 Tax=Peptostreptococcus stomatis TaxID=341694 RepID=UPI0028D2BD0C|nr:chorismate synthase [Peptostreptococcus stomatis]